VTDPTTSTGVDARLASVLCYAGWWITGIVFLFAERRHPAVRFHAAQSIVVFGAFSLALFACGGLSAVAFVMAASTFTWLQLTANMLWLAAVAVWLVLLVRTWHGDTWRVPLLGELAQRLAVR
jgi:uncharacterized membrane protein